ncbi:MAG: hypothetical protein IJW40_09080 [Clostridia bacterium]|nr:hypothetical protein [Clostridia bacterium]
MSSGSASAQKKSSAFAEKSSAFAEKKNSAFWSKAAMRILTDRQPEEAFLAEDDDAFDA